MTSTSLDRAPAPSENFVRGKSGHVPFWPGGLDAALAPLIGGETPTKGLRTVPPGFSKGLSVNDDEADEIFDLGDKPDGPRGIYEASCHPLRFLESYPNLPVGGARASRATRGRNFDWLGRDRRVAAYFCAHIYYELENYLDSSNTLVLRDRN